MLRKLAICMALMLVLLSGGCGEVSAEDSAVGVLLYSMGVIISSWPVVILLTLLGRRLNLVRNQVVLRQYKVYVLIQIIISLTIGLLVADSNLSGIFWITVIIIGSVFVQVLTLPYLLLIGSLLILVLPERLLVWVPSFLLVPHYLIFGLQWMTNMNVILNPVLLMAKFVVDYWYLAIPFGVVILIGLLIRRRLECNGLNRPY